ncbi:MAG: amphi-Trp domain-containing protein [Thiotrichales bacterium]|nr:MAG: amphi-Trp domain-containing protein [Thiotrichales bacterium]
MKNGDHDFRHESMQDRETIVELLSSLQQGLEKGTLRFSDEDNEIVLEPSGLLNLAIKASSNAELNVLDVRISWQGSKADKLKKQLKISDC